MAYNVFIGYSSKNMNIVDWARTTLAQPGHVEVFAAEYSVLPSQVLNDEIETAIRACDLFVLLWSHDARASDYVPQEIGIAKGCKKTILPVVMEDNVPVPGFISTLKYLDAHKNWDGSFIWLTNFVRENAAQLQKAKVVGALVATILGGIVATGSLEPQGHRFSALPHGFRSRMQASSTGTAGGPAAGTLERRCPLSASAQPSGAEGEAPAPGARTSSGWSR